jgi:hypothetical protein
VVSDDGQEKLVAKKVVQFDERKGFTGKPYSVIVALGVRSDTDDRDDIVRSLGKFLDRLERKSVGTKKGIVKIETVTINRVIGTEKTIDWFRGMLS